MPYIVRIDDPVLPATTIGIEISEYEAKILGPDGITTLEKMMHDIGRWVREQTEGIRAPDQNAVETGGEPS